MNEPGSPSRRIRIARVIARLNVGGPARHVVWLTEALNDDRFQSVLVTGSVPDGEDDMTDFATAHGVQPMIIKEMSRELSPRDLITVWKLFRFFLRFKPDIVHSHTAKAGATARVAGLLYRLFTPSILTGRPRPCRFVHTFHGHIFHHYYGRVKTLLFVMIERILARFATDRIIVLSDQQLDEIHRIFRVGRREQFRVIPLGIDLAKAGSASEDRKSLRDELAIDPNEVVVGIVGRLVPIKNHEMFLEAASAFRTNASRMRFVVYGDGPERQRLERRHGELGLGHRTIFAGLRAPAEIYESMDIATLTSLNEGTPLTLIEAMARGLPIVSTAVGGVVDVLGLVEHTELTGTGASFEIRERGITVAAGDVEGFGLAVNYLSNDEKLRTRFAERGPAYVRAMYSKERLVRNIIDTYQELIDGSRREGP